MRKAILFMGAAVFLLMFTLTVYDKTSITGFASINEGIESGINDFSSSQAFAYLGNNAIICIVVEANETYYYDVAKQGNELFVDERYCADPGQNNVIIKFNSYEDFAEAKSDPANFIKEKRNTGYYVFPSNYVEEGGNVQCSEDFRNKYCGPLYAYLSSSEILGIGLPCCSGYTPSGFAFGILKGIAEDFWIPASLLVLFLVFAFVFSRKKKEKK